MHKAALERIGRDLGDLLASHERGRDLSEFGRYAEDPVGFIRDVLHGEPWSRQVEIAEAVKESPLVVVRSAQAVGKDWIAGRLALWWVYARGGLVLLTGPTERQVREVVMGEVARAFGRAKDLPGEMFQMALRLGREEKAGIIAFTSTEASKLTGFHAPLLMAILTEAQGCEGFAWEGLLACATGAEDRILAIGNPLAPSGRFYAVSRPRSGWKAIRIAADEHPNLREGKTVIPGGPSPEFAERIASEYGRQSGVYMARVLGEFPDQGEEGLFRRSHLERAVERWEEWLGEHAEEEPIVAVDPARFGPDLTCCAVRRGPVVESLHAWGRCDLSESVDRIREVLQAAGVRPSGEWKKVLVEQPWPESPRGVKRRVPPHGRVIVDEVGLGAGVLDRLKELEYRTYGFNGGRSALDGDRYLNARAEAYWRLREKLEAGELALPPDEKLMDELIATRWRPTPEGKVRIEAKDDLKARLGRSPDRADAVVMAVAGEVARKRLPLAGIATA